MNKTKLRNILKAISPDETKVDFSPFDNEVQKLKEKLKEQVVVKTLEDVNVALEKNRKRINFEPLTQAFNQLKQDVESKNTELLNSLNTKQTELKELIAQNSQSNDEKINELTTEVALMSAKKIPDFGKQIQDTEKRLVAMIDTVSTLDVLEDEEEDGEVQKQFAVFEKQIKDLKTQFQQRGGGSMPFKISINGTVLSTRYADINFKGSGITYTATNNDTTKQVDLTLTSSGGGYTVETPTGTVDGSNVTFTVTVAPVYIVSDGTTYFENQGYTISGLTVTLSVPPTNFIRSFHS